MAAKLPRSIPCAALLEAAKAIDAGESHAFGPSSGYDVLINGRRYPPKAVVGVAAKFFLGHEYHPSDFKGGLGTECFSILESAGFDVVRKVGDAGLAEEEGAQGLHVEGATARILVSKYERDRKAKEKCVKGYGPICVVCGFEFGRMYGELGDGYIHVHHLVPISEMGGEYVLDPLQDLVPVCANCHAMMHLRRPPYRPEELAEIIAAHGGGARSS